MTRRSGEVPAAEKMPAVAAMKRTASQSCSRDYSGLGSTATTKTAPATSTVPAAMSGPRMPAG